MIDQLKFYHRFRNVRINNKEHLSQKTYS